MVIRKLEFTCLGTNSVPKGLCSMSSLFALINSQNNSMR